MKTEIHKALPESIKQVLYISNGWLVGSAPWILSRSEVPKDYDVIVETPEDFLAITVALRFCSLSINTFGGHKYVLPDGNIIDIWMESLGHFIKTASKFSYAYQLRGSRLISNTD